MLIDRAVEFLFSIIYEYFNRSVLLVRNVTNARYVYPKWLPAEIITNLKYKHYCHKKADAARATYSQVDAKDIAGVGVSRTDFKAAIQFNPRGV